MTPETPERTDPAALIRILWRWKLLFLAVIVAAPVAAFFYERSKPKEYQSSTLVSVASATVNGDSSGQADPFSTSNTIAIARLITTSQVANTAARALNPPGNPGALAGAVSATGDQQTGFITITAQSPNPRRAADIANAFAVALRSNRTGAALSATDTQIATLLRELAATPANTANSVTRQQLQQQLLQLRAARASQSGHVAVLQPATASSTPVSPHVRRAVELGLVIGLLLAIGAVAVAENSDRRIRSPADLEELTKLPLLSAIPPRAFSAKLDSIPAVDEAFQMLRAALTYFNIGRPLRTVVITSPGEQEGKTTVAVRLAVASALSGKRVILVDADLRRAQAGERLGFENSAAGLGTVLVGEHRLADALSNYPLSGTSRGGQLSVLPAGPPPPNPSELLSSQEMQRLLASLETQADLVIIDTPPALAVSDTMPLLSDASGIVLVARINKSKRDGIRRVQRLISTAGGTILGIVATGTGSGPGSERYGYGYYGTSGKPSGRARFRRHRRSARSAAAETPTAAAGTDTTPAGASSPIVTTQK